MIPDHIKMVYELGELNNLFAESLSLEALLQKIVNMVSDHMKSEVCSIYIYDEIQDLLILKATKGLNPESVNNIKLRTDEGIVGLSFKELKPINEKIGKENPNFKFFPGILEELYDSFLAVPISRGKQKIGVLVVQRNKNNPFDKHDIMALQAVSSQLRSIIENLKVLTTVPTQKEKEFKSNWLHKHTLIKGNAASKGFAYAESIVIDKEKDYNLITRDIFNKTCTYDEFISAVKKTEGQLKTLQKRVEEKLSDAASLIFSVHLLMLKDKRFIGGMEELIKYGENPISAIIAIYNEYKGILSESPNSLIKDKIHDLEDLVRRIIDNLLFREDEFIKYEEHIIITRDIFPSDLLKMSAENISGIILVNGGITSHVSILARSLQIPLIIVDSQDILLIPNNTKILMDTETGLIYIDPLDDIVTKFLEQKKAREKFIEQGDFLKKPTITKDGQKIELMINVNLLSDINLIGDNFIEGIGLYRTEFPFMIRTAFPSEEEQYYIYCKLIKNINGKPITFRTLDIGGDKILPYYNDIKEQNPFLGMRSIRFSLEHIEIFKQQIKAILRAAINIDLKIMFPMIASLDDLLKSKKIVKDCIHELKIDNIKHNDNPKIGIMVEIPSAIIIINDLVKEVDFISIGTNDLIQYTLAVDRTNEKVAYLYKPHHPAVLKSLKKIADAAIEQNIEVSICGDMANDDIYIPFIIGIGIRVLSIDPIYVPKIKKKICEMQLSDAKKIAEKMLAQNTIHDLDIILDHLR